MSKPFIIKDTQNAILKTRGLMIVNTEEDKIHLLCNIPNIYPNISCQKKHQRLDFSH